MAQPLGAAGDEGCEGCAETEGAPETFPLCPTGVLEHCRNFQAKVAMPGGPSIIAARGYGSKQDCDDDDDSGSDAGAAVTVQLARHEELRQAARASAPPEAAGH